LEIISQLPPDEQVDMVLLEIRLRELAGYSVCHALQERWPGVLTVFRATRRLPCLVNGARHADADASCCKLVDIHELAALLIDESQAVARAYRAACTPDFFLFNREHRLVYRGQLDDSRPGNGVPVTGGALRAALDNLLAGRPIAATQPPAMGCGIKWKADNDPRANGSCLRSKTAGG